jgi:hypothetical protein
MAREEPPAVLRQLLALQILAAAAAAVQVLLFRQMVAMADQVL